MNIIVFFFFSLCEKNMDYVQKSTNPPHKLGPKMPNSCKLNRIYSEIPSTSTCKITFFCVSKHWFGCFYLYIRYDIVNGGKTPRINRCKDIISISFDLYSIFIEYLLYIYSVSSSTLNFSIQFLVGITNYIDHVSVLMTIFE